jgi:predicted nuclease of predicted toxin-antitoxin system
MTFLLDENFPKAARRFLEERSHVVLDSREIGDEGAADSEVFKLADSKSADILTTDRDFFHTLGRQHPIHHGIIVVALKKPTRAAILERLAWLLDHVPQESISGRAFQLRDRAWQVYPPLQP